MQFNIADLFECVADTVPQRPAVVCGEERLRYDELDERSTRLAHVLAGAGAAPGTHVALYVGNSVRHVVAMLACYKARAVPMNVNYRYVDEELEYLLADADAVIVVHDTGVRRAGASCRAARRVRLDVDELADAIAAGSPARDLGPRSGDDHYVLYTGGTTGMPKGVVWRQEDIFFGALGGGNPGGPPIKTPEEIAESVTDNPAQRLRAFLAPDEEGPPQFVALALGPLMHASGQWSALGTLLGGGKVVLYDRPSIDMEHVLDLIEERARQRVQPRRRRERASAARHVARPARPLEHELRCVLLGSGGSILSGDAKDALDGRAAVCAGDHRRHRLVGVARAGRCAHDARRKRHTIAVAHVRGQSRDDGRRRRAAAGPARLGHRRAGSQLVVAFRSATTTIPIAARGPSSRSTASAGHCPATWRRSTPTARCTCSAEGRCASTRAAKRCTPRKSKRW